MVKQQRLYMESQNIDVGDKWEEIINLNTKRSTFPHLVKAETKNFFAANPHPQSHTFLSPALKNGKATNVDIDSFLKILILVTSEEKS